MENNRNKLFETYRKTFKDTKKYLFNNSQKVEYIDDFLNLFVNEAISKNVFKYFQSVGRPLYKDGLQMKYKTFLEFYCCDLQWAKDGGYCGTQPPPVTPPPGPPPPVPPGPPVPPVPSTSRYTQINYTGQDIINGETIEKGMKGDIVKKIQEHLNKHGANPTLVVDGKFWNKTKQAVKDFQKSKGLPASGVVEDKTWLELVKNKSSSTNTSTPQKPAKDPLEDIYGTGENETPLDLFNY